MRSTAHLLDVTHDGAERHRTSSSVLLTLVVMLTSFVLGVGVTVASAAQLNLRWTDNANGTAAFMVERRTEGSGTYVPLATTGTGATSYVDATIATDTSYCYRVKATNAAGESAYSNEACGAAASSFDVTIAKAGAGAGTVASSPAGITCGADCFEAFPSGTLVTLTATPASGSVFTGWSGAGCTGTGPCIASGNTAVNITATFSTTTTASSYTMTVTKSGTGAGTVVSSPSGINCGAYCSRAFKTGTTVTLSARPASGSVFSGWSGGGCSGTGKCAVTMNAATTVTAEFSATTAATTYTLWSGTATPQNVGYPDTSPVTLGVKVRADVNGYIRGIRFYKASTSTGPHVGSLYTSSGQLLATVTFTNETAAGWQEARFSTPVAITANTIYVAAYHTTVGRYSVDTAYFSSRTVDAGPLHAPSGGTVGGNGVFRYGSTSAFPNQTYNGNNYWVDVLFSPR